MSLRRSTQRIIAKPVIAVSRMKNAKMIHVRILPTRLGIFRIHLEQMG